MALGRCYIMLQDVTAGYTMLYQEVTHFLTLLTLPYYEQQYAH